MSGVGTGLSRGIALYRLAMQNTLQLPRILCVTGRGESLEEFPGRLSWYRQVEIGCIECTGYFARRTFSEQVAVFRRNLSERYWHADSLLLGRSFGAWIMLNGLMELDGEYPGTVILVAPVLGFGGGARGLHFIAPRTRRFWSEAESRTRPPARRITVIISEQDEQCPPEYARRLCALWGMELIVFEQGGHGLGKDTLQQEVSETIHTLWSGR